MQCIYCSYVFINNICIGFTTYPKIYPKRISTEIYASVTFQCSTSHHGNIQIQWKKLLSSKLPQSATIVTFKSDTNITSTLKIDKINHHYKGYYYCTVKDEFGEVKSSLAQLHVDGMFIYLYKKSNLYIILLTLCSPLPRNIRSSCQCCSTTRRGCKV